MKSIKFNCPACGANIEISSISNNSNNSTNMTNTKKTGVNTKTAEDKITALRNAGVDVSNLFSMKGADGGDALARLENGQLSIVADDDPILQIIVSKGTIPNRRLFRRWIMAQMFHMLTEKGWRSNKPIGFTEALNRKGYKYSWKMIVEEFRVQAKLFDKDPENFYERNRWFNKDVALSMAQSYLKLVQKRVSELPKKHCKRVPYIHIGGRNIFVADLYLKLYSPINKAINAIGIANTPEKLACAVQAFERLVKETYTSYSLPQDRDFKDAYKGAGAYYTLKNLILFHGCTFTGLDQRQSMNHLSNMVANLDMQGYQLLGVLKEFLKTNNIDIAAKQAEWRK